MGPERPLGAQRKLWAQGDIGDILPSGGKCCHAPWTWCSFLEVLTGKMMVMAADTDEGFTVWQTLFSVLYMTLPLILERALWGKSCYSPCYKLGNWGKGRLHNLLKVTLQSQERSSAQIWKVGSLTPEPTSLWPGLQARGCAVINRPPRSPVALGSLSSFDNKTQSSTSWGWSGPARSSCLVIYLGSNPWGHKTLAVLLEDRAGCNCTSDRPVTTNMPQGLLCLQLGNLKMDPTSNQSIHDLSI